MFDVLDKWQEVITILEEQIFNKNRQRGKYVSIWENLSEKELLKNLDFSKNFSNHNKNTRNLV